MTDIGKTDLYAFADVVDRIIIVSLKAGQNALGILCCVVGDIFVFPLTFSFSVAPLRFKFLNVSRVIDGDTFEGQLDNGGNPGVNPWAIELTRIVIRISGIDAPERGQYYGDVATLHLHWLISGKAVGLKLKQRDSYGRWIATAYLDGADIAEELLQQGLAWHYKEYDSNPRYAQLEAEARQDGRGLWCDDRAVPPWEWRRMSKFERDAYR